MSAEGLVSALYKIHKFVEGQSKITTGDEHDSNSLIGKAVLAVTTTIENEQVIRQQTFMPASDLRVGQQYSVISPASGFTLTGDQLTVSFNKAEFDVAAYEVVDSNGDVIATSTYNSSPIQTITVSVSGSSVTIKPSYIVDGTTTEIFLPEITGTLFNDTNIIDSFTAVSSAAGQLTGTAILLENAPAAMYYKLSSATEWIQRDPSENSSRFGTGAGHNQTVTGLPAGEYDVRMSDHITGLFSTETIKVIVAALNTSVQVFNDANLDIINPAGTSDGEVVNFAASFSDAGYLPPPAAAGTGEVMQTIVGAGMHRGSSREGILLGDDVLDAELEFYELVTGDGPTSGNFKKPGLAGETSVGGGGQGGSDTDGTNAWSGRGEMHYRNTESSDWWLTSGSEVYHQDDNSSSGFGDSFWNTSNGAISGPDPAKHVLGVWAKWKQRVRVNDVGMYNGIIQWYKNDVLVYERANLRFSQVDRHRRIHKAWMLVYHGGAENTTSNVTKFYFAGIKVNILETRAGNAV